MTSPAARIAALREAGYRGPVDMLGFADSGDRVADMARNYWAGREARQKEERQMVNSNGAQGPQACDGREVSEDLAAARDAYQAGDMTREDLEAACSGAGAEPDDLFAGNGWPTRADAIWSATAPRGPGLQLRQPDMEAGQ